ncbi:MAG: hypothetical protein PVG66_04075 [Chromatiales bacterium]
MSILKKLPGSRREPHGLEWKILKKLPYAMIYSGLVVLIFTLVAHLMPPSGSATDVAKFLGMVDILAIAILTTVWIAILTIAIGAFVVYVMKGPAYVIDPYEMPKSDDREQGP